MRVVVGQSHGRLVRDQVPAEFVSLITAMVDAERSDRGNLEVVLELRNSLAMQSAVHFDEDEREARIVLDWSQFERLPAVLRALDRRRELTAQGDELRKAFARELRVYWKRRLISARVGDISSDERQYNGVKNGDPPHLDMPYSEPEVESAMPYAAYALGHELGHVLTYEDPDLPLSLYARFEEAYPRLIRPSTSLPEELFCDHIALRVVADLRLHESLIALNEEFALILALGRLQSEVLAAMPRIRAGLLQLGPSTQATRGSNPEKERMRIAEWRYRIFLADLTIAELMAAAGHTEQDVAAAKAVRVFAVGVAEALLQDDYMGWFG